MMMTTRTMMEEKDRVDDRWTRTRREREVVFVVDVKVNVEVAVIITCA
jgi:hypothetical protein